MSCAQLPDECVHTCGPLYVCSSPSLKAPTLSLPPPPREGWCVLFYGPATGGASGTQALSSPRELLIEKGRRRPWPCFSWCTIDSSLAGDFLLFFLIPFLWRQWLEEQEKGALQGTEQAGGDASVAKLGNYGANLCEPAKDVVALRWREGKTSQRAYRVQGGRLLWGLVAWPKIHEYPRPAHSPVRASIEGEG